MSTAERNAIAAAAAKAGDIAPPLSADQARQQLGWGLIPANGSAR